MLKDVIIPGWRERAEAAQGGVLRAYYKSYYEELMKEEEERVELAKSNEVFNFMTDAGINPFL